MKIALVVIGKTESTEVRGLVSDYAKRLSHYTSFELVETTEEKIAKSLGNFDRIFLLDDKGVERSSTEFASFIGKQLASGAQSLAFAVGGPYGFSPEIHELADGEISLSRMTFPHDLVRAIFMEQLYRAFTILKNEKYHHE